MAQHNSIHAHGMRLHYQRWCVTHPDAVSYDRLVQYLKEGDEFGEPLKIRQLKKLTKASKPTILKWLPIIKQEEGVL